MEKNLQKECKACGKKFMLSNFLKTPSSPVYSMITATNLCLLCMQSEINKAISQEAQAQLDKQKTFATEDMPKAKDQSRKTPAAIISGFRKTPESINAIDPKINQKYITIRVGNELDHFRNDQLVLMPVHSNGRLSSFKINSSLHTANIPITSIRGETPILLKWASDGRSLYGIFTDFWSKSVILLSSENDYNDMKKYILENSHIKPNTNLSSWSSGQSLWEIEDERRRAEDSKEEKWDRD